MPLVGSFAAAASRALRALVVACNCTPAYVTGNRTASITVTVSGWSPNGTGSNLVDGDSSQNSTGSLDFSPTGNASGRSFVFDFGSGNKVKITEAKWYQSDTTSHGTWQWAGSNDNSTYTDIGSTFTLGGATTQTQTELASNQLGYRYYKLYGVSGTASATPWLIEIEFKQCTCP